MCPVGNPIEHFDKVMIQRDVLKLIMLNIQTDKVSLTLLMPYSNCRDLWLRTAT